MNSFYHAVITSLLTNYLLCFSFFTNFSIPYSLFSKPFIFIKKHGCVIYFYILMYSWILTIDQVKHFYSYWNTTNGAHYQKNSSQKYFIKEQTAKYLICKLETFLRKCLKWTEEEVSINVHNAETWELSKK